MTFCTPYRKTFFAKYYERTNVAGIARKCNMYPYVSGELKPVERHSNAGSLSEMTVKADVLNQEWDIKVFITFYKFSVTEE